MGTTLDAAEAVKPADEGGVDVGGAAAVGAEVEGLAEAEFAEAAATVADPAAAVAADPLARASDARVERMDHIAVLYAEITAATRAFLQALAVSDRLEDWRHEGFSSCAEWLAWRLGLDRNTAREKVRTARALEALPRIGEAMAQGVLSYSKVRALTRAATPESEAELLELARSTSAATLERIVRAWKTHECADEQARERLRHRSRRLSVFCDEDGMYVLRGRLTPEVGALLLRAVEAAADALFVRGEGGGEDATSSPDASRPEPRQLRADALGLLAERALAAGFGGPESPVSGSRAERYQVVLHVEPRTLTEHGEPGQSELEDGTRVSAETARRLSCDAALVPIRHAPDGSVLDVGRRTRTIPPALRRALETRDRGCRFPGCGLRFTSAHHIEHWADGGATTLANTILLCRRHHRVVHEDGWRVCTDRDGRAVFFSPRGEPVADVGPPTPVRLAGETDGRVDEIVEVSETDPTADGPTTADARAREEMGDTSTAAGTSGSSTSAAPLQRRNRERGVAPDERTSRPRYRYERDVPWPILAAAMEALDPCDDAA